MIERSSNAALIYDGASEGSYTPIVGSSGMSYKPFMELGEGGMARVFLARASGPGGFTKLVVLKTLRKPDLSNVTIRQMFLDEARLCARLHHPNLVQVQEVNLNADPPCLVMEYLDGKPLSALRGSDYLDRNMLLTIISEVLSGLHYAHELANFDGKPLNIVHRDVSPHNVFVTYDGTVKVLDFGIAKMATAAVQTETGEVKGKLTYMAPEQLLGNSVDRRADIFAVGSMLWEAAVGTRMWENVSEGMLMHQLASGNIPQPSQRGPVDEELEKIVVKATASKPEDRHATALELQREVDRFIARSGGRSSLRDIGSKLALAFKEERERNQEIINRALRFSLPPEAEESEIVPEPRRRTRAIWLSLIALASVAGAAILLPRLLSPPPPVERKVSAPAQVTINVRARPALARIEIDGKDLGQEQVTLRVVPDAKDHVVRITAPNHVVETRVVKFDRNRDLEVLLREEDPEPVPEPVSSGSPRGEKGPARRGLIVPRKAELPAPKAPEHGCTPPYYFKDGIKTYKPECL